MHDQGDTRRSPPAHTEEARQDDEDWDEDALPLSEEEEAEAMMALMREFVERARPMLGPRAGVAAPSRYEAGRNDPCPCGSGKKFKRCHG